MIAALFVQRGGCYYGLSNVDPWDKTRDARLYEGPYPVVAHPPCERWGRYWSGGPSAKIKRKLGDDDGCFASALGSVRTFGGVLEHPEASHAFVHFGLGRPTWRKGWEPADDGVGQICCVAQGNYGHRARKLTWLYAVRTVLPTLDWSIPKDKARLDCGFHSVEERQRLDKIVSPLVLPTRLRTNENNATPIEFRDVLISMAESVSLFEGRI